MHKLAVSFAGRQDDTGRRLHKALDHRHKLAVTQFTRAGSEDGLREMWRDAVRRGDIPSAYWATLTHPLATQIVISEAFGDVHMLSHLVGSANRADIKRLCVLEHEKVALEAKIQRQQVALHQAVAGRDRQIAELRQALADRILVNPATVAAPDTAALHDLVADRERRLAAETRRRVAVEERLVLLQKERDAERSGRLAAEKACAEFRTEDDPPAAEECGAEQPMVRLDGCHLLYVGGRPNQVVHLRSAIEALGGTMIHHDGGLENHPAMLPGLASGSDCVVFPVDCISHDAARNVKALCRKTGKRYIPLRSTSVSALLIALRNSNDFALAQGGA